MAKVIEAAQSGKPPTGAQLGVMIGVVMGSSSDWDVMQHAVAVLQEFGIAHEAQVISAHRMPDQMFAYAESARERGLRAIIAGAGDAALTAVALLAATDERLAARLHEYRAQQTQAALAMKLPNE